LTVSTPSSNPEGALTTDRGGQRPFGVYVHVPWCGSRCGYCDFNTYVPGSLAGASPSSFLEDARTELRLARERIGSDRLVDTVFFGGGTPTLLPAADLVAVLAEIDELFGLAPGAEVTTEANPESVDQRYLAALLAGHFTRLSLGMQSAVPKVLATLDRVHTPGRALEVVKWAKQVGFDQVSLDLIYGTPGESDDDWDRSIDAVVGARPTHVSAYSLIVEDGTRMARQVRSGELIESDSDVLADRYLRADEAFASIGLDWYEVSNWGEPCRHNLGYWRSDDWWGIGPGAHSHLGGTRWWNVKHPATYSTRLATGQSPTADREELTIVDQQLEDVMLRVRMSEGISLGRLGEGASKVAGTLANEGLVDPTELAAGNVKLSTRGRLLADLVIRRLSDS